MTEESVDVHVHADAPAPAAPPDTPVALREALRVGGTGLLATLFLLAVIDEVPRVALAVLAPDIQNAFGISDTVVLGLIGLTGVALVLSTLPAAALGDRLRRTWVIGFGTVVLALSCVAVGFSPNAFLLGIALVGAGFGVGSRMPNASSLLADGYPLAARTRVYAAEGVGRPIGQLLGPLFAGSVAAAIGGPDAWRWVFLALTVPFGCLAVLAFMLRDPPRGQYEQQHILGTVLDADEADPPISLSAAFRRLKKVRSFYFVAVGIAVLGFALVSVPSLISLLLERDYGYAASTRGWMLAITWSGSIVVVPLLAVLGERRFAREPADLLRLAAVLLAAFGVLVLIGLRFSAIAPFIALYTMANAAQAGAFVLISPAVAAAVPARMRSQAFAMVGLYVFLFGGFFGNVIAGSLSDAYGERTALTLIVPVAALAGAAFLGHGARFLVSDIGLVTEEIREDADERRRIADGGAVAVLQARNLDVSYGSVQVLFDCEIEVARGECVALLGTNGAGKSTLLRTVLGLTSPDRGVVRLNGRTITDRDAEYRFGKGIVAVRGGDGVFSALSVKENLDMSFTATRVAPTQRASRVAAVLDLFPVVAERLGEQAGDLSGGQRQQLALARALLLEPEILLIDELSLGLAPIVVQSLISIIEQLRARGQTILLVEQSMNIALSLCDRVLYMEKGRVTFDGTPAELAARGDLVKSVFFGAAAAL
jgi:ABC-type branched-subunit amino acid transport system ATPase component/MFS family permease